MFRHSMFRVFEVQYFCVRSKTNVKYILKLPPKTDTRFKSIDRNTSDSVLSTLLSFATHSLSMSLFSQSGESQKPLGHSLHDGLSSGI